MIQVTYQMAAPVTITPAKATTYGWELSLAKFSAWDLRLNFQWLNHVSCASKEMMSPDNFLPCSSFLFVIEVRIYCLKDASGSITSPDFGASYPKDDIEVHYFINVTEVSPYHDLLFTVDVMDINGGNGDYIKIGKGVTTKECMECQCQGPQLFILEIEREGYLCTIIWH